MGVLMAFLVSAVMYSCKDDDPSLAELRADKLAFLADSLRISDSLKRINAAGVVNYAVTVVDGSTSSIFAQGKTQTALDGVVVTVSQFGKTLSDTTDATGIAVFNGFFKSAVNVTVRKEGFTSVSYIAQTNLQAGDSTGRGSIAFVGNIIPIFATTGANTATISGIATIQSDLTNSTRENVPDGTTIHVGIDASANSDFSDKYLTRDLDWDATASCGCDFAVVGRILQASYQTGIVGTVTAGAYTVTVPAAVDELPLTITYSDVALTQTLFESTGAQGQRTVSQRASFIPSSTSAQLYNAGSNINVSFAFNTTAATGTALLGGGGASGGVMAINVTNAGQNYTSAPVVQITGGGGSGAAATATVAGGRVTGVTITNAGTNYTGAPTVTFLSGSGATAAVVLANNATVSSVSMTTQGFGYVAAPTVTFGAPLPGGTTATGTAVIDGSGRVTGVTITNPGSGYPPNETTSITFSAAPGPGGVTATGLANLSGVSIQEINITANGNNDYTSNPTVIISAPQRPNGTVATANAVADPVTRDVSNVILSNGGTGYLNTTPVTVTIQAGSGATATAALTGTSVVAVNIPTANQGSGYVAAPQIVFGEYNGAGSNGGGSGATGTAIMQDGKVVGVTITNGGSGYLTAPTLNILNGEGAFAEATVVNGAITAITVTDGGRHFTGAPRVIIQSADGGGATATATVANGAITGVTVGAGGSGYLEGNTPAAAEAFESFYGTSIDTKPGIKYVNDLYWGTGTIRFPN